MKHQINSSMIKTLHHSNDTLEVEFPNGNVYQYPDVTEKQFKELLKAESVGKHFNSNFRGKAFIKK